MPQLILQPDPVDGADTYINGDAVNTNYGSSATMSLAAEYAYHACGAQRALLRFDLTSLPSSAQIASATLQLFYHSTGVEQTNSYSASCYRCPTAWTESGATWNKYDGVNAWPVNGVGGDWDSEMEAICTQINGAVDLLFDITAHVEDAMANRSGVLNLLLKITGVDCNGNPNFRHRYYSSDEAVETAKRPKLVIEYDEGTGASPTIYPSIRPLVRPTIRYAIR